MAAKEAVSLTPEPGDVRRGEGLIIVTQNNSQKSLVIQQMNSVMEKLLGYEQETPEGRRFEVILNSKTAQSLEEEIEYKDDAPDLGDVLQRQRELRLRHRSGSEITVQYAVSRLMAEGMNARFQLVIPNELDTLAGKKIREFLTLNLEGRQQLDAVTQLPNRETALHFLPLLKNYLKESQIEASIAVLRLDRHAKSIRRYGASECVKLLQHTATCCRNSFRGDDLVFTLSDHTLGIVLIDISRESARLVLNRLRWNIRAHAIDFGGKSDFSITVTVAFDMLDRDREGDRILLDCEQVIAECDAEARNALIEPSAA